MKKKILIGLMAIMICVLLVGCGKKEEKNDNNGNSGSGTSGSTEKSEYNYFDGKLTQIVDEEGKPKQTDFVIDGIILAGNRHTYDGDSVDGNMEYLSKKGYKKEGLNKDFYLNEWIELYIDTKYSGASNDVKILITPHKTVEELETMSFSQLQELATENGGAIIDYETPDEENYKYVGNGYVNADYPDGKYDILFTYKGQLTYFININETKEAE